MKHCATGSASRVPWNRLPRLRRVRVAARRDHDADQFVAASAAGGLAQPPLGRRNDQRKQGLVYQRKNHLRSGSPSLTLNSMTFRTVDGQHQSHVQNPTERIPFLGHSRDDRLDNFMHDARFKGASSRHALGRNAPIPPCSARDRRRTRACDPAPIRSAAHGRRR